jgi:hypothetical protein
MPRAGNEKLLDLPPSNRPRVVGTSLRAAPSRVFGMCVRQIGQTMGVGPKGLERLVPKQARHAPDHEGPKAIDHYEHQENRQQSRERISSLVAVVNGHPGEDGLAFMHRVHCSTLRRD